MRVTGKAPETAAVRRARAARTRATLITAVLATGAMVAMVAAVWWPSWLMLATVVVLGLPAMARLADPGEPTP